MKIIATSCSKVQDMPNVQPPVWKEIQDEQPDMLLLLGDNVYLKTDNHKDPVKLDAELDYYYRLQKNEPHFKALLADMRARGKPVLSTYDDHDFLGNDRYGADHNPALREVARAMLRKHFDPPATPEGDVYSVTRAGLVDIFVLDERFYRKAPAFVADEAPTDAADAILGAKQWAWFEREFQAPSTAHYRLVVSSTTVHSYAFTSENWEKGYPQAFQRLRNLMGGKLGALVVSGDIHRNEIYDDSGIVEIVTSAVARYGTVFKQPRKNYGVFTFDPTGVRVQLRCLKVNGSFDFIIPRISGQSWELPGA